MMTMAEFKILRLDANDIDFPASLDRLLAWDEGSDAASQQRVKEIIVRVKTEGDIALVEYTSQFDHYRVTEAAELELSREVLKAAWENLPQEQAAALETANERIRIHAEHQKLESWRHYDSNGTVLGQQVTPLDRVGVYAVSYTHLTLPTKRIV